MSWLHALSAIVSVALLIYLVYALINAEEF
jgi:K+-transporting ATPase KdpF subunit